MQHIIRAYVVFLAVLAVLPAAQAIQTCTQKFSDLKVCTLFNGQFATGNNVSLAATTIIDGQLIAGYNNYNEIHKNDECKAMYLLIGCIGAVSHPDFPAAAPCSTNGARLKQCKGLCVKYFKTCVTESKTDAEVEKYCTEQSAPAADECFGDAGVLGMKSAAHHSVPPVFVVAFFALVACLGM